MTFSASLLNRLVLASAIGLFTSCASVWAQAPEPSADEVAEAREILDELALGELMRSPEWTAQMGDSVPGWNVSPRAQLDDRSPAAFERARIAWVEGLSRIEALPEPLASLREVEIAHYAYSHLVDLSAFGYGRIDLGMVRPYAVDHMQGAFLDLIDLMSERQRLRREADIDPWLKRLERVPVAIDQDLRRMRFDGARGIVPPPSSLALMREAVAPFLVEDATANPFYVQFGLQLAALQAIPDARKEEALAEAAILIKETIRPAYERFDAGLAALQAAPASGPGMWALPNGDAYYRAIADFYSSGTIDPEEAHRLGRDTVTEVEAELDRELAAIGLVEGTVGERLATLSARKDQIFPDTDEGRAALLASLRASLDRADARMGDVFLEPPRVPLAILPVPDFLSASAPTAYYRPASIDGSRPGYLYINLRDTAEWPAYTLPTLIFHEGLPGHHADAAYRREGNDRTLLSRLVWVSAYTEGWATYAEDVAFELGLFDDDPLARIGYYQSVLFRSVRLVVDTGLHLRQWTREEAVDYLVSRTGLPRSMMESEVDRYLVWPGQALTYMVGRQEILRLREQAEAVLGDDFDLREFHDAILSGGPRPLSMVAEDVTRWQAKRIIARDPNAR